MPFFLCLLLVIAEKVREWKERQEKIARGEIPNEEEEEDKGEEEIYAREVPFIKYLPDKKIADFFKSKAV